VEASLLPSKAIRTLCKQTVVAVIRCDAPAGEELRQEFAIPWLNSWVVVLDGKGETLASWVGDSAGAGCSKGSVARFPRNLVRLIRESMERGETVEELDRRWRKRPRDMERFEAFARRLEEMHAHGKLYERCQDALALPGLSGTQRDDLRLRAFAARASDHTQRPSTRKACAAFVREGERLLVELAAHPRAGELVGELFYTGYADTFDVPSKSARAIARLERAARQLADATALKERIRELTELRQEWITRTTESLQRVADRTVRRYFAATLGDAREAIKLFSQASYRDDPKCREWLREARQKLEREQRRIRSR
jgi:hypothetical protein